MVYFSSDSEKSSEFWQVSQARLTRCEDAAGRISSHQTLEFWQVSQVWLTRCEDAAGSFCCFCILRFLFPKYGYIIRIDSCTRFYQVKNNGESR